MLYMSSTSQDASRRDGRTSDPRGTASRSGPAETDTEAPLFWGQSARAPFSTTLRRLRGSLIKREVDVDLKTLADAMREVLLDSSGLTAEPLTAGERDFLRAHADVSDADFSDDARNATRAQVVTSRADADERVHLDSLSTAEVSELTGRSGASIRRSANSGDLFVLNPGDSRGLRFPAWQFDGSRLVPGISDVLSALPDGTHPLVIERFMREPRESLDGLSPLRWLATDGDVAKVVRLADDRAHE